MVQHLYFDALTMACLTGAIASLCLLVLRPHISAITMLICGLWLAGLAGSKSQHAPIALCRLPLFWVPSRRGRFAPLWTRGVSTLLVVAGVALSLGTIPPPTRNSTFNVLFYRILPIVPDPARYIAETRIPPDWIRYIGQHTFLPDSPLATEAGQAQFAEWFGPTDLIRFYARHPVLAWRIAEINLTEASFDRVRMKTGAIEHRLGNYEQSVGKPPQALSHFLGVWPAIKHAVISGRPIVYLAWILCVIGAGWALAPDIPRIRILLATCTACLVVAWAIPMLDGLGRSPSPHHIQFPPRPVCVRRYHDVVLESMGFALWIDSAIGLASGAGHARVPSYGNGGDFAHGPVPAQRLRPNPPPSGKSGEFLCGIFRFT